MAVHRSLSAAFNADVHDVPARTIRGDEGDSGDPHPPRARWCSWNASPSPALFGDAPRTPADARSPAGFPLPARMVPVARNSQRGARRRAGDLTRRPRRSGAFHASVVAEFGRPRKGWMTNAAERLAAPLSPFADSTHPRECIALPPRASLATKPSTGANPPNADALPSFSGGA